MKKIHFICYDGQPGMPPLIAVFTVDDNAETEDIIETFGKTLHEHIPDSEDCPPMRYAADRVCEKYDANVVFCEADQEFGLQERSCAVCPECGVILSEDRDSTAPSPHNTGFSDEAKVCWACCRDMLERGEMTQCESCRECFTYDHLMPNRAKQDHTRELCPYCGEIWCE